MSRAAAKRAIVIRPANPLLNHHPLLVPQGARAVTDAHASLLRARKRARIRHRSHANCSHALAARLASRCALWTEMKYWSDIIAPRICPYVGVKTCVFNEREIERTILLSCPLCSSNHFGLKIQDQNFKGDYLLR